jgi:hypothetical protein
MMRIVHALTVGTNESYPEISSYLRCLELQFFTLGSGLTETTCDDHRTLNPLLAAILDGLGHEAGRYYEYGQVRRFREIFDIGMTGKVKDAVSFGVYRVDGSLVPTVQDISQNLVPQFVGAGRGSDDCHTLRFEDGIQLAYRIRYHHDLTPMSFEK